MRRISFDKLLPLLVLVAALSPPANAYVRLTTQPGGGPLVRTDFGNIQFLVNDQTAAGMLNDDAQPTITAGSDPIGALQASLATWNNVATSAAQFAPLQTTSLTDDGSDGQHVFIFTDTPEHRTLVGGALGITWTVFNPANGELADTDIIFNPTETFSTNLAADTFDLESTATHELGHALGAGHTVFLAATMYQAGLRGRRHQATLSSDDTAFLTSVYPAPGQQGNFGAITGTVTFQGGGPVRGAFVVAIDRTSSAHVCALSSINDGTYTISGVPPGSYMLYVEPLNGPVFPGNVQLPDSLVDVTFRTTPLGTFDNPTVVNVAAGGQAVANITVEPVASAIDIEIFGVGSAGGTGDATYGRSVKLLAAGGAADLIFWGPGLDGTITQNDIHLLGPGLDIRPGSLRLDQLLIVNGYAGLRMTVDVAAQTGRTLASVVIAKGVDAVAYSGSLIVAASPVFTAAGLVNSASFAAGALAPDSWADLYGQSLATQFVIDGSFPTSLDGTSITITDSQAAVHTARLHFVMANRIQFLMPPNMAAGSATLRVTNSTGADATAVIQLATVGPGLFSANASGQGPAAATFLTVAADQTRTEDFTFTLDAPPNRANVPIDLGSATDQVYISFFGTGFRGQTSVSCRIGGVDVNVFAAVAQGEFAGLDQAVVGPVPRSLAGQRDANVIFTFNGVAANTVTVSF